MNILHIFNPFGSSLTLVFAIIIFALLILVILRLKYLQNASNKLKTRLNNWKTIHFDRFKSSDDLRAMEIELKDIGLEVLAHPLSEFREATFNQNGEEEPLHIYPASCFITPERFRDALLSKSTKSWELGPGLLDAIPGLFTAIGILGTFIGLVLGLSEIGENGMPDVQKLMGGLHVSFKSSIYGLMASLISTVGVRWINSQITYNIETLTDWLDGRMVRGTEHALLVELVREQKQATAAIKTLKDDIREAFQGALNESLVPVVQTALNNGHQAQLAGINQIVDGVLATISSQLGDVALRFEDTAKQIQTAGQWWDQVSRELTGLTTQQQQLVTLINNSLQPMSSIANQLTQVASNSEIASKHMLSAAQKNEEGLMVLTAQLEQTLNTAQEALNRMEVVRGSWHESAATLHAAGTELNQGFMIFTRQFPKAIETTMSEFDKELAGVAQRLATIGNDLRETFDELHEALEDILAKSKAP